MSGKRNKPTKALVARPGYEVGYGRPPKNTRFEPGQSGNPRGRPKGSRNKRPRMHEERMKDIILDEAYRNITIQDGERDVSIPMAQAVIRSMAVNAAKGQHRAQRLFAELLASVESSRKLLHDEYFDTALTYKLAWEKELQRRERLGLVGEEEPYIHPDRIIIDMDEGTVRTIGPMTREGEANYAKWKAQKPMLRQAIEGLEEGFGIRR